MQAEDLKPNKILRGPIFPEPVQIIVCIPMGDAVKLIAKGLNTSRVYEPVLTPDQLTTLETTPDTEPFDGDPLRFRLAVEAMRLALAFEYDPYFSLSIARVDPLPHQLEAVYQYFMALPRIRFLLADDPGAGKTIMAGLLLKELKIRGLVKRTLIITPANLSFQWQREMKDKFRENFEVIRSDVLRANYGSNPWQDKNQVITSVSWVSRIEDAKESLLRSHWDLIIVDEAHKMSAASRDKTTLAYDLGAELSKMTDHYGQRLADEVRKWGEWIKREAEKELAEFYPKDADGATPIAYLWARTIQCEGPGCGAEVPLIRAPWLVKKEKRSVAFQFVPNLEAKRVDIQIIVRERDGWVDQTNSTTKIENPNFDGTVKRGSATCRCCGYTTPVARVRVQLKARRGGANDARLTCVVLTRPNEQGRLYRVATEADEVAIRTAAEELIRRKSNNIGVISLVPEEPTPLGGGSGAGRAFSQRNYGMDLFADLFTNRQLLAITTLARLVRTVGENLRAAQTEQGYADAVQTVLAQVVNKQADYNTSLCSWHYHNREKVNHTFHRQAIPMVWDFVEPVFFGSGAGSWPGLLDWTMQALDAPVPLASSAHVELADAAAHPMPNDSAQAFVTDPPYYDAVPYSDLSDFFYVWFKRTLPENAHNGFTSILTPKKEECIVDEVKGKDAAYFEATMKKAMSEGRRVLAPSGIGIVVFAHKSTAGWEAQLQAMVDAGWIITGSWPIDTEMGTRLRAQSSAALASSVHLVCRPRENSVGTVSADEVGDWRDVLQALPIRIHEWMPRLAEEGVVGADAIFACLGPALEIYSRYSRVEKANGETVTLKEYLEQVWAAVAKEALALVFKDADTLGFEEDARLTAMWLWTINAGSSTAEKTENAEEEGDDDDEASGGNGAKAKGGFMLEYDAARKIAQGLGAHLEDLTSLVEVAGEQARLLPVGERAQHLFGKNDATLAGQNVKRKKRDAQMDMFKVLGDADATGGTTFGETKVERHGETVLDRIHQSMILFAAGRSEAMKRFLVEDGAGRDPRFWRLAQALSALYPSHTEEKRWVDGVLARKKGLGF